MSSDTDSLKKSFQSTLSFRPHRTIVLVGLMGAGKTSIGRRLAKRLDLEFFDSDHEVEASAGCPIKEIYNLYGEEAFKKGEYKVINRLLDNEPHVLATGGGSFKNDITREKIKEKSISVWLKADIDTLVARVSRRSDRPLLEGVDQRETLLGMIDEMYPIYGSSDIAVDTFDEPTGATVDRVVMALTDHIREKYPNEYVLKSLD
jgi:shikimate kinase